MHNEAQASVWEVKIVSGEPEKLPREVAAAWDRLALDNSQSTIFQDREFVTLWFSHKVRVSGARLLICYAKSTECSLEVVLPMVHLRGSPRSLWTRRLLAAGEPNFDFQEPLVSSKAGFSESCVSFWKTFTAVLIKNGYSRFTIARTHRQVLPDQCERDASKHTWKSSLSGFQSLDQYLVERSSNLRGDVNRRMRRMNDAGIVAFEIFSAAQLHEASQELRVMQQSYEELWKGQPAAALFQTPGTLSWYRALIERYLPTGMLHFSRLLYGGEPIAWHFGFLHHGILHWYKPTYRKNFAHLSPGKVLLAQVIQEGICQGWKAVDYGPGTEAYKQQWANECSDMFRWEWNGNVGISRLVNWVRRHRSSCALKSK